MVRITEELVRRRSEHNDGILHSLRELTLHQFEIERIELLGSVCRHLQILYLQNNLIGRIEGLARMKELQYLNLAVNNITLIEELDRCESLTKLDLTLNFIDVEQLEASCQHLQTCLALRHLYLMGNPLTTAFTDWRLYVIGRVPQLDSIDSIDVTKTERILARTRMPQMQRDLHDVLAQRRQTGPERATPQHTPEARTKMYREMAAIRNERQETPAAPSDPVKEANRRMAQAAVEDEEGQLPRQRNQGRWQFNVDDDDDRFVVATIKAPKYLDTSQIDVDVHPRWFQCLIKGKRLLLHLTVEVSPSRTNVLRVITTGDLVIKMARVHPLQRRRRATPPSPPTPPPSSTVVDIRNIVSSVTGSVISAGDVDDTDVPPLE